MTKLPLEITASMLVARNRREFPVLLQPARERIQQLRRGALAANTLRAYERAWEEWLAWCQELGADPIPATPQVVEGYLVALADTPRPRSGRPPSLSLIDQHVAAIAFLHRLADQPSPTEAALITLALEGIRRERGADPEYRRHPKTAATPDRLVAMLEAIGQYQNPGQRVRDRAVLLTLASHGLRRSEVEALVYPRDLVAMNGIPVLHVHRTKTDAGKDTVLPLLQKSVNEALAGWIGWRGNAAGPLFVPVTREGHPRFIVEEAGRGWKPLRGGSIAGIVRKAAQAAGIEGDFAGHSIRRGFVTTAYALGDVPEWAIQKSVGHRTADTTRSYREEGKLSDPKEWAAHIAVMDALLGAGPLDPLPGAAGGQVDGA